MRDLKSNISVVQSLAVANHAALADGAGVDLLGFNSACAVISAGVLGGSSSPSMTFQLQESDDNITFGAVADADLQGTEPVIAASTAIHRIGYIGNKRYIRVSISAEAGTDPALFASAIIILGNPESAPVD